MTTALPLPGEWIDFGRDLTHVAAHPSRLWVAVVRTARDGTAVVEHHDLATRAVLSVTEVPTPGDVLTWVGDRVALIEYRADLATSYVDVGVGCVDVVYVAGARPHLPFSHPVRRSIGGVDLKVERAHDAKATVRLTVRDRAVAVEEKAVASLRGWHPDGACVVIEHRPSTYGRAYLNVRETRQTRRIAVPGVSQSLELEVLGFSSPDHFVLLRYKPPQVPAGPGELWSVDWKTGALVSLNDHIDARAGWLTGALCPDGRRLAVIWFNTDAVHKAMDTQLIVVDARTGDLCLRTPVTSFANRLSWVGTEAVVTSLWESLDSLVLDVCSLSSPEERHFRLNVPPTNGVHWPRDNDLQPLDAARVLYAEVNGIGRCFVSDPLVPR